MMNHAKYDAEQQKITFKWAFCSARTWDVNDDGNKKMYII